MTRLVFISHVFYPDSQATSQLFSELLAALAARGGKCEVMAGFPAGREQGGNCALVPGGIASDRVLFLDADEEVTPELQSIIQQTLTVDGPTFSAYELTPRYLFWGRWLKRAQGYPNWHARMVRVGEVSFTGGVWEHFESNARIGRIAEPYKHCASSKGFSDWLARHDRFLTWDAQRITAYLETGEASSLGTGRKLVLRQWAARWYPLRPFVRFIHTYFLRLGFIEGLPAFVFCSQYFIYEWMTVIKVIELRKRKSGVPL